MKRDYHLVVKRGGMVWVLAVFLGFVVAGDARVLTASPGGPEETVSPNATPEVAAVDPPSANQGAVLSIKITGRNFVSGAKVSFSNPGVTVTDTEAQATEITASIQVARDAEVGTSSVFVTNPNGLQAESPFAVVASAPVTPGGDPAVPTTTQETGSTGRFEVYNLGEGVSILQNPNKAKGVLSVVTGKIKYEEAGKQVFSVAASEIKEIDANSVLGFNTGTFHIILNSGRTYNFAAGTLSISDGQKMLDSLKRALQ